MGILRKIWNWLLLILGLRKQSLGLVGVNLAPPFTSEVLNKYRNLDIEDEAVRTEVLKLVTMAETFYSLPWSLKRSKLHAAKFIRVHPLSNEQVKGLKGHILSDEEYARISTLFGKIPTTNPKVRNAAFHLLWLAQELRLGREPLTMV